MILNNNRLEYIRPAWLEIDLDGLASNVQVVKSKIGSGVKICASLKANAYGHGTLAVAQTFRECGVERFSVAIPDEGIALRKAGFTNPILVLGYSEPERAAQIVEYDLEQTVFDMDMAKALSAAAVKCGKKAGIHIKFDSGMGRLGYSYFVGTQQLVSEITEIAGLPGIELVGIFTHFATADEADQAYTNLQFQRYLELTGALEKNGVRIPIKHCSNSSAVLNYPQMNLDMVRPGVLLYCMPLLSEMSAPSADPMPIPTPIPSSILPHTEAGTKLLQIMSLKARVSRVEKLKPGMSVSYGRAFIAQRPTVIAALPLGYGDGLNRLLSCGNGEVLIHGKRAPVAGRICMDQCMVDVTDIDGVQKGDEAVLLGRQGGEYIDVDEMARKLGTINYEVTSSLTRRLPRVYRKNGSIQWILNDYDL